MRELKNLNEEALLFFDIETATVVKGLKKGTPLYDSWAYKVKKEGITTDKEIKQSFKDKGALYPEFSKVITIVAGKIQDGFINLITFNDPDEKVLLDKFNKLLNRRASDTLTGFFNIGFDTPFVFRRNLINGLTFNNKLDSSGLKPWEVSEVDLAKTWQLTSYNRASLINISTAFGLPSCKDDMSGSDVGDVYWGDDPDKLERIAKYCRKDVVATINIFKKMKGEEPLSIKGEDDIPDTPLILNLFKGGKFDKEEKEELGKMFDNMTPLEREEGFVILNSLSSTRKAGTTLINKAYIKTLRSKYE